ncbi:hypothetical protein FA95DRAFT_1005470 [Auriscalpium vulgare]|uniref:Uncharacterized protein n=1 Tax=Auriscalpium vulgare TaxID=40419 RepID=A0ACB8RXH0_9AGAM|nr:hypothetical protein FA95DRAFT_1005470 [Auriscalpium vulgare]
MVLVCGSRTFSRSVRQRDPSNAHPWCIRTAARASSSNRPVTRQPRPTRSPIQGAQDLTPGPFSEDPMKSDQARTDGCINRQVGSAGFAIFLVSYPPLKHSTSKHIPPPHSNMCQRVTLVTLCACRQTVLSRVMHGTVSCQNIQCRTNVAHPTLPPHNCTLCKVISEDVLKTVYSGTRCGPACGR